MAFQKIQYGGIDTTIQNIISLFNDIGSGLPNLSSQILKNSEMQLDAPPLYTLVEIIQLISASPLVSAVATGNDAFIVLNLNNQPNLMIHFIFNDAATFNIKTVNYYRQMR